MTLQQITYVLEVYRQKSYTKAAQALYVSQPRLSKALQELEEELGYEIFQRTRRGIRGTTTKGYAFIKQAEKVQTQFDLLQNMQRSQVLRLSVSTTLITQAQEAFTEISLENVHNANLDADLWFCGCYESLDRVRSELSDVAIVTIMNNQLQEWLPLLQSMHLEYMTLLNTRFHVTVSQRSPLSSKESISLSELDGYTFITEKCSRMNDLTLEVYALMDRVCPSTRITVSNTDIMYSLLDGAPEGKTFVLDSGKPSPKTMERYHLVSIPVEEDFNLSIGYVRRRNEKLPTIAREFIQRVREKLALQEYN